MKWIIIEEIDFFDKLVDVEKASECWGIFVWEANPHFNLEWLYLYFKINFLISINTEKVFPTYSFDLTKAFSLLSLSNCSCIIAEDGRWKVL